MNEQTNTQSPVQMSALSVSELFIKTREEQGYSIEQVANHLRVSQSYIEAIESNNISNFPARVYILGFVRSYAHFLHLDPQDCCRRFKREVLSEQVSEPNLNFPTLLTIDSSPSSKILKISLAILVVVIATGIFMWQWQSPVIEDRPFDNNPDAMMTSDDPSISSSPSQTSFSEENEKDNKSHERQTSNLEIPDANKAEDRLQQLSDSSQNYLTSPDLSKSVHEVNTQTSDTSLPQENLRDTLLTFTEDCWVKIQDDSQQIIIEKTFQTGEQYHIPLRNNYTIHTGNAGGIQISNPTMSPKVLGKKGQVIANLSLDSETLSAYLNQQ